ncbi:tetratricopeptide repeat protein [Shouchella sp. 1P09AA]|uniref:response regulator aspartate phosphatase n=1 Tax=unclassified Shouchella TaxID=2893065 RepID=UPI0039A04182
MIVALSASIIGGKLVEWHSCLIAKNFTHAQRLRNETKELIKQMESNDKILAYYQLVSFKHELLSTYGTGELFESTLPTPVEIERDDYLNFMFYFVSAQNEFLNERYKSAVQMYKVAERLIEKVNDPAEKAEFYQELGMSYYRIDQYTFAASYMDQALEFFGKNAMYLVNEIRCKLVLAAIDTELGEQASAEKIYKEMIEISKPFPYYHSLVLHNLGQNRMTQQRFDDAVQLFEQALSINEFSQSITGLKSTYNLLNARLRNETYIGGLEELEFNARAQKLMEIKAKCKVSRGLYLEDNFSEVEQGLDMLKVNEKFFECSEVCDEISQHFEQKGDLANALKYARLVNHMSKKQSNVGVDLL